MSTLPTTSISEGKEQSDQYSRKLNKSLFNASLEWGSQPLKQQIEMRSIASLSTKSNQLNLTEVLAQPISVICDLPKVNCCGMLRHVNGIYKTSGFGLAGNYQALSPSPAMLEEANSCHQVARGDTTASEQDIFP